MGAAILTRLGRLALHDNDLPWADLAMLLFSAPGAVTVATVIGDLTEAVYDGYARQNCVFDPPAIDGTNRSVRVLTTLRFQHDGGATPDTVLGWGIVRIDVGGSPLLVVKLLDEGAFTFADEGDFIDVDLESRITQP